MGTATLHNFAFCDATEVCVLLAGYAAGSAYGRRLEREGGGPAASPWCRRRLGRRERLAVADRLHDGLSQTLAAFILDGADWRGGATR